jgi:uncharacterized protein with HEPN domain
MDPKARALLYDIQQAGTLIVGFTSGKAFEDYANDPLLRSGVERQLEIIGEALKPAREARSRRGGEDHQLRAHHRAT